MPLFTAMGQEEMDAASKPPAALPDGDYDFTVSEAGELKQGKKGQYFPLWLEIVDPATGRGRRVKYNVSLSPGAAPLRAQFAVGVGLSADQFNAIESPQELVGLAGRARVVIDANGYNEVKRILRPAHSIAA
jgi:hypothetical protein